MNAARSTSRGWYLVGIGLIGCALAIAITGFFQMTDSVRGLQRVVMPGKAEVTLAAGKTILYFETRSVVDGTAYAVDEPTQVRCRMLDTQGQPLALSTSAVTTRYGFGDHAGHSLFDVDVPAPGTYTLECQGEGRFVIALGGGVGAWIVVALVGGLVPGLGGIAVCLVVFLKRRGQRRRARAG